MRGQGERVYWRVPQKGLGARPQAQVQLQVGARHRWLCVRGARSTRAWRRLARPSPGAAKEREKIESAELQ